MTLMLHTNITRVMNKSIFKICLLSLVCTFVAMACNRTPIDMPEEDYNQLFPFKGLEKPVINYEDMPILVGDPETSPQDYVYQGVTFPTQRSYQVRLTYSFEEPADLGDGGLRPQSSVRSKIVIRYVGADKQLHELSTARTVSGENKINNDGKEHSLEFTLTSGQPLYLAVSGYAARSTTISAKLEAHSEDGLFTTPILKTKQTQNYDEGEASLPAPYCKYIILP